MVCLFIEDYSAGHDCYVEAKSNEALMQWINLEH